MRDDPPVPVELAAPRSIHVVNVGGAGMSAIATVLAQMGHRVSGVDANETPFLGPLRTLGIDVVVGDRHPSAATASLVVTSTATPADHPDLVVARAAGTPVVHRGDVLEAICARRRVVAVAGTHGKSTTSALLATAAVGTGAGFLVGTRVTGLGTNADWGRGPDFVVEADESDGTFLRVRATHAVVTNLEADHLSYWGSEAALVDGFRRFVGALEGSAVVCLDDPGAAALAPHAAHAVTYGTHADADHHISAIEPAGVGVAFTHTVRRGRGQGSQVRVTVPAAPGVHNARNAAGALAAAVELGLDLAQAAGALSDFAGVARRFEVRGEAGGITFVDSYDHLPTEVAAAVARGPVRPLPTGGVRLPAPPLHAHPRPRTDVRRRLQRCRRARDHRAVPGRRAAHRGRVGAVGVRRRHRGPPRRRRDLPRRPRRRRRLAGRRAPPR